MSIRPLLLFAFTSLCLPAVLGSAHAQPDSSDSVHPSADNLSIQWGVETNLLEGGTRHRSRLTIRNQGEVWLPNRGWTIYFNFLRRIDSTTVEGPVNITRINGDFHKIEPVEDFGGLAPDRQMTATFEAEGNAIKYSDAPSGYYVVFTNKAGNPEAPARISDLRVQPFTRPEQTKRHPNEVVPVPTGSTRYEDNRSVQQTSAESVAPIVPTPVSLSREDGSVALTSETTIYHEEGLASEARLLADALTSILDTRPATTQGTSAGTGDVLLRTGSVWLGNEGGEREEAYQLAATPEDGITIVGQSGAGVLYGIQSLRAWLPVAAYESPSASVAVPAGKIVDAPRFGYRGMHLDVARNFQSVETVKRLLDLMAFYKFNTFHLHLTDDEGWRLAIDGLPELTEVGGRRGHTLTEDEHLMPSYWSGPDPSPSATAGSGWYSAEDYVEIVRYAKARHIEVIPEVDLPGHARAAIKAMQARGGNRYRLHDPRDTSSYETIQGWDDGVVNVCQPSTYRFFGKVLDEIQALHEKAGAPLQTVHVGGDEVPEGVWAGSPVCEAYIENTDGVEEPEDLFDHFLSRIYDMIAERGLSMKGWEEIALTEDGEERPPNPRFVDQNVQTYAWQNVWGNGRPDRSYPLANAGYDVVMSHASNFYFGTTYSKHPAETGVYWAGFIDAKDPFIFMPLDLYKTGEQNIMGHPYNPKELAEDYEKLEPEAASNILGLQGQLWGEMLWSADRLEYMAMPRMISLAERAWARQPEWARIDDIEELRRERDEAWSAFAHRLGRRELPRLSLLDDDWSYRLPPPGGVIEDGMLKANVALPGLSIRYTTDGTAPTPESPRYTGPVSMSSSATVRLRTFDGQGRGSRTVSVQR